MATEVHNSLVNYQNNGDTENTQAEPLNPQVVTTPPHVANPFYQGVRFRPEEDSVNNRSYASEAAEAGFGESKYDVGAYVPGEDLENRRAVEQSGASKIINGVMKGGVYTGTTAVNTVLGTIVGAGTGIVSLAQGKKISDSIDDAVNNKVSSAMINIEQLSEKWFPNYKTEEERSERYQHDWVKHILTPNFIGDSFLKNFGFTAGAMLGGMAWAQGLGMIGRTKLAGDLLKGVTAAANGNAEVEAALGKALQALRTGTATTVDIDLIKNNIQGAAKAINRMGTSLQLIGATISAMGEGTVEGLMAKDEFINQARQNADDEFFAKNQEIQQRAYSDPRNVVEVWGTDENGNFAKTLELNDRGKQWLRDRQVEIGNEYRDIRDFINEQGDRLASTTFLLNLPILTVSDTLQFGRMLSGGWKTTRKNLARTVGGIRYSDAGKAVAEYGGRGNVALGTAYGSLKVGGTEALEELSQGYISSGTKNVADARITAFNDDGYDKGVAKDFADWLNTMNRGGMDYLGDWKNWQEGFLGMVTGLMGIPGRRWNGGIAEAYRNSKERVEKSRTAADLLNREINSDEFQKRWQGYSRHNLYEKQMEAAVKKDDQYSWQTANDKQLISDIMMFADAGRLNDLYELVDRYSSISDAEAREAGILEAVKSDVNSRDVDNNPEETIETVKKHAQNMKDTIDQYSKTYDAMLEIAPTDIPEAQLKEFIFTAMQSKKFEQRYFKMLGEVLEGITPTLRQGIKRNLEDEEKDAILKDRLSRFADIYSRLVLPDEYSLTDLMEDAQGLDWLRKKTAKNTKLHQKVIDMEKISNDRRAFYQKFNDLKKLSGEEYLEEAKTQEKATEEVNKEEAKREVSMLESVGDIKRAYRAASERGEEARAAFLKDMEKIRDKNLNADMFMRIHTLHSDYDALAVKNPRKPDERGPVGVIAKYISDSIFNTADTVDQVYNAELLPTKVTVTRTLASVFGKDYSETELGNAYDEAVPFVRENLEQLAKLNNYMMRSTTAGVSAAEFAPEMAASRAAAMRGEQSSAQPSSSLFADDPRMRARLEQVEKQKQTEGEFIKDALGRPWKVGDKVYLYKTDDDGNIIPVGEKECTIDSISTTKEGKVANLVEVGGNKNSKIKVKLYEDDVDRMRVSKIASAPVTTVSDEPEVTDPSEEDYQKEQVFSVQESGPEELVADEVNEKFEQYNEGELNYYHQSVPEIDSINSSKARSTSRDPELTREQKRKRIAQLDLRDFDEVDPAYKDTWQALANWKGQNAFENILKLRRGDEIQFVIDPNFPVSPVDGKEQILVYSVPKNGEEAMLLTVLHAPTEKNEKQYRGLGELQETIRDKYSDWTSQRAGDVFTFTDEKGNPYKSKVFAKRSGFVVYNKKKADKSIKDLRDPNAPIVFIDRRGNQVLLSGTSDYDHEYLARLVDKMSSEGLAENASGNLYYIAPGNYGYSVPIRLNVVHYTKDTMGYTSSTFNLINSAIDAIVKDLKEYDSITSDNIEDVKQSLHEKVADLGKYLNISDIFFTVFIDQKTKQPKILIKTKGAQSGQSSTIENLTSDSIKNILAAKKLSVQLGIGSDVKRVIKRLINDDILTANVDVLRPKGNDFCFYSWDADAQAFTPTPKQVQIQKAANGGEEIIEDKEPGKKPEVPQSIDEPSKKEDKKERKKKEDKVPEEEKFSAAPEKKDKLVYATMDWDSLPKDIQEYLEKSKGIDKDSWEDPDIGDDDRRQMLGCS